MDEQVTTELEDLKSEVENLGRVWVGISQIAVAMEGKAAHG